jgi:hypothetical protein
MTGGERDQLVIVQQQLGDIKERVVVLEVLAKSMKETQDSNAGKIDILVDRVADNRLENYKNGLLAAAVAALVSAFGGSVR